MINWKFNSKDEIALVSAIAERAERLTARNGVDYSFRLADMDISACHLNGCPLRLNELLNAGEADFGHDVFGIRRHIDRNTGKLTGCFTPRFAVNQS